MANIFPIKERFALKGDELNNLQLKRLKWTVENAKNSKFYKNKLSDIKISKISDINKLPLTDKNDLRKHSPFEFLSCSMKKIVEYHESFGTTGTPTPSWLSKSDFEQYTEQIRRGAVGFKDDDIVLIRFPYAISVPAHIFHAAAKKNGACVIPASSRTVVSPHSRIIKLMKKLNVTIFCSLPFESILLAETAKLMGYNPSQDFENLRAICIAGELCTKARQKRIERVWNSKVYNFYGTTETGNLAATCPEGELHGFADHFLFEVLDPKTHEPVAEGEKGELCVTTLTREAMPLIRYKTGDIVKIQSYKNCSCSWEGHPIIQPYGRITDTITYSNNKILPGDLEESILELPETLVGNLWIGIVSENGLLIRAESIDPKQKIPTELINKLSKTLRVPISIELLPDGTLFNRDKLTKSYPSIKPRYITDWRKEQHHPESLDELLIGYHTFV